jgi:hypothetical protein
MSAIRAESRSSAPIAAATNSAPAAAGADSWRTDKFGVWVGRWMCTWR